MKFLKNLYICIYTHVYENCIFCIYSVYIHAIYTLFVYIIYTESRQNFSTRFGQKKWPFAKLKMGPFFSQNVPFCAKKCPLSKIYQKGPYNTQFENVPKKLHFFKMRLIIPIKRALFRKWDPKIKVPF